MHTTTIHLWMLVIATTALAGWWIAVRPRASYRGVSASISGMILLVAVLMGVLALRSSTPTATGTAQAVPGFALLR